MKVFWCTFTVVALVAVENAEALIGNKNLGFATVFQNEIDNNRDEDKFIGYSWASDWRHETVDHVIPRCAALC